MDRFLRVRLLSFVITDPAIFKRESSFGMVVISLDLLSTLI